MSKREETKSSVSLVPEKDCVFLTFEINVSHVVLKESDGGGDPQRSNRAHGKGGQGTVGTNEYFQSTVPKVHIQIVPQTKNRLGELRSACIKSILGRMDTFMCSRNR